MWYVPRPRHRNFSGLGYLGDPDDTHIQSLESQEAQQINIVKRANDEYESAKQGVNDATAALTSFTRAAHYNLTRDQIEAQRTVLSGAIRKAELKLIESKTLTVPGANDELAKLRKKIDAAKAARSVRAASVQAAAAPVQAQQYALEPETPDQKLSRESRERIKAAEAKLQSQREVVQYTPQQFEYKRIVETAENLGADFDRLKAAGDKRSLQRKMEEIIGVLDQKVRDAAAAGASPSGAEAGGQRVKEYLESSSEANGRQVVGNFVRELFKDPEKAVKSFGDNARNLRSALTSLISVAEER